MGAVLLVVDEGVVDREVATRLVKLAGDREVHVTNDPEKIASLANRVEVVGGWIKDPQVLQGESLKWFQTFTAGVDAYVEKDPELLQRVIVTNATGVHAVPGTEQVFAMLLALIRHIPRAVRNQSRRLWDRPSELTFEELHGKSMLIVGMGAIGKKLAATARAFGMEVNAVRRNVSQPVSSVSRIYPTGELHAALREADVVVMLAPYTPNTHHMLGPTEFEDFKPGSIFISVGRGKTVDETALIDALQQGRLGAAALDVFDEEPLPESSPLWDMANVLITPHQLGQTQHYDNRCVLIFLENLARYVDGRPLHNLVDPVQGY